MDVVIIQTGFVCGVFSATVVGHVTYDRCDSTDWFCLCCVFSDSGRSCRHVIVVIVQTGSVCVVFSVTVVGHDRYDNTDRFCLCCVFSDSLAFATEPVIGSLANVLGNFERLPANVHQEIKVGLNTEHSTVVYTVH